MMHRFFRGSISLYYQVALNVHGNFADIQRRRELAPTRKNTEAAVTSVRRLNPQ